MPSIERFAEWASKFKLEVGEADKSHPWSCISGSWPGRRRSLALRLGTFDQVFRTTDLGYYHDVRGTPTNELISQINQLSTLYMATLITAASPPKNILTPRDPNVSPVAVQLEFWFLTAPNC
ncbi:hypothetical protein C8J56DRAFT_1057497 [Mycena floridula]|nr:hypothetical protein C8J56DRAFT_1057497 [Mycena floridula]